MACKMALVGLVALACLSLMVEQSEGHGMMLDPPNRSSAWRYFPGLPINYNDNANYCGGNSVQNGINGGKCGVCGDDYRQARPRDNENGGKYGTGYKVGQYASGSVIQLYTKLTANHLGSFHYSICRLSSSSAMEAGEDCFFPLSFESGATYRKITPSDYDVYDRVKLPNGFQCEHCVLRWHYRTGNSWGTCEDGSGALGCGPQETFRSCSDIRIY